MVKAWSWAAAALAYAVIPAHCAAMTVPKNNLALEAETDSKPFQLDIPEGNLDGLEDYISSSQKRQEALPSLLYRGSGSSPEYVKERGGFVPRQEGGPMINETFSLQSHHLGLSRTAYTSTTRSFGVAFGYSLKTQPGWIYKVHPTPNMIDLDGSGLRLSYRSEEEFSALGGIRYDQIEAWMPLSKSDLKEYTKEHIQVFHDFETFSAEYPEKTWTVNPDYDHKYDSLTASPGQPQLAGNRANLAKYNNKTLEQYAIEFMQKNGAAVDWDGKFPLSSLKTPPEEAPVEGPLFKGVELCVAGPDGKVKYGATEKECNENYYDCLVEALGATSETTLECMETKVLAAH